MTYAEILTFARQLRKTQTAAEQKFWEKVRGRKVLRRKFFRQYIIKHAEEDGMERFFIADFICLENKLIVEIDGSVHLDQAEYDQFRQGILEQMKFTVIRFSNEDVLQDWEKVENGLKKALA